MSKPFIHAKSSAKKFGGEWTDYMPIHEVLDSSKSVIADNRHRALTHNSWFISVILPKIFGEVYKRPSDGGYVSTRDIAEQHVLEDYKNKFIPSASDFLTKIPFADWMQNGMRGYPDSYQELHNNNGSVKIENVDVEKKDEKKEEAKEPTPIIHPSSVVLDGLGGISRRNILVD